ncbi:helix-turn-helix domain-containing protein [Allofournierella sp.]|uniref:helix-turn-helix domain-containing protein n=1 Tax=Allofournierella sp. TaxID=1940256 RepID=UPI003AEFF21A
MDCEKRLRDLRQDNDLTQSEIAKILFIRQSAYSKYELGKACIPLKSLFTLARFYNVSVDYISGASDEKRPYPKE